MVRPLLLDAPAPFALWRIDLRIEVSNAEEACLSAPERERAARFVFERDRRRYRTAHASMRMLIGKQTGEHPAAIAFREGAFGKPALSGAARWAFNLSHSDDIALLAMHPATAGGALPEIGVDVEVLRPMRASSDLARMNFTSSECLELEAADIDGRDLAFLRGWTRKEAVLKAIGSGLSIAPHTFEAGLSLLTQVVRVDTPAGVTHARVWSLPEDAGTVSALARVC